MGESVVRSERDDMPLLLKALGEAVSEVLTVQK